MLFRKRNEIDEKTLSDMSNQPLLKESECHDILFKFHCLVVSFAKTNLNEKIFPNDLVGMTILFIQGGFIKAESMIYRFGIKHDEEYGQVFFGDTKIDDKVIEEFKNKLKNSNLPISEFQSSNYKGLKYIDLRRNFDEHRELLFRKLTPYLKKQNYNVKKITAFNHPFRTIVKESHFTNEKKYFYIDGISNNSLTFMFHQKLSDPNVDGDNSSQVRKINSTL